MMIRRARTLLGTLVTVSVVNRPEDVDLPAAVHCAHEACDKAFARIAHIGQVMSAHDGDSDLAAMASARPGQVLQLDADTCTVLRVARAWSLLSNKAFDPVGAGMRLSVQGMRPGLNGHEGAQFGGFADIEFIGKRCVKLARPVRIDLGGIAKGYAVDEAVRCLQELGVHAGLVNAGGDLRAFGPVRWPVEVRHAGARLNDRPVRSLRLLENAALASSVARPFNVSFVAGKCRKRQGAVPASCTVLAADCVTADVLTKWVLQSTPGDPRLQRCLRAHQGRLWTSP